jgi:hypothetical protein
MCFQVHTGKSQEQRVADNVLTRHCVHFSRRSMCLLRNERANTSTSTATLYSFLKMLDFEAYEQLLERAGYSNVAKLQEANMLTLRNSGLTIGAARRMMAAARMAT